MNARENLLKAIKLERPDHIPMSFGVSAACWQHYKQEALEDLMLSHPMAMVFGMYPGIPLENARAIMDAMERYAGYWSG